MTDPTEKERWDRGVEAMDMVYGPGSSSMMRGPDVSVFGDETVRHLFGEIWSRPGLSVRDKRLLVIGATTMLGRADLITIQVAGAIVNGELTDEELEEMPLLMLFYSGAACASALSQGIQAAKIKAKDMKPA